VSTAERGSRAPLSGFRDVVITGGSGFIGAALARRLRELVGGRGRIVAASSSDVDLVDSEATFDWFSEQARLGDVSHIIHLAAVYKAGGWPAAHPATQFHLNMALNVNTLEAWKRFCPRARFTSVVSYCMYPDHDRPHPESEMYGTEPEPYLFAYAFTKKALVIGQRAYRQEFGLSATTAVLPTVYGPGDSFEVDSHVMGALIGKFGRAAQAGDATVEVWGTGEQEREFLFVEDAASGIIEVALAPDDTFVNLGTGEGVRIAELARLVAQATKFEGRIVFAPQRFVGAHRRVLSVERARRELGWRAKTSLVDGIMATTDAFRALSPRSSDYPPTAGRTGGALEANSIKGR